MNEPDQPREAATAPRRAGDSFLVGFLGAVAPIIVPALVSLIGTLTPASRYSGSPVPWRGSWPSS